MLTRLELVGFKSFADKTRFDFAPGITAVVGPNGSGKSNVVDAVKWVLGEQSAKALRGGEMADVIFNGSSNRKSLGLAEVTLTFDNRRRILDTDADDVEISRRVYRDGQGEYLINGQLARLRDIKQLFLGSGAGQGAYSVIEQGRVDALLSASANDRRQIFEEAAGISRFKAKKNETLGKLDRVEADLVRARDILTELEKQLRTLRLQAAKAQRYREYSDALRERRLDLGLREYLELSVSLTAEETQLAQLRQAVAVFAEQEQSRDKRLGELESALSSVEAELKQRDEERQDARRVIASSEATARSERTALDRHESELLRAGQQRVDLARRVQALEVEQERIRKDLANAEANAASEQERATLVAAELEAVSEKLSALQRGLNRDRQSQFELARTTAKLQSETETTAREVEKLHRERTAKLAEQERTTQRRDALKSVLDDLSRSDASIQEKLNGARTNLAEHIRHRDELRKRADELQRELETHREERSALRARADVLEGLEKNFEGLGAGVRSLMQRRADVPELGGLVGECLTADREHAAWIDLALGETAQHFVVLKAEQLESFVASLGTLPGRVGFVPMNTSPHVGEVAALRGGWGGDSKTSLRLSNLVRVERPELNGLPEQLLGQCYLVEDWQAARELHRLFPSARILTRQGEVLEADGRFTLGPLGGAGGMISRKSELRELTEKIAATEKIIREREHEQTGLRRQADAMDAPVRALETEIAALGGEVGNLQNQLRDGRLEHERLSELIEIAGVEGSQIEGELAALRGELAQKRTDLAQAERDEQAVRVRLEQAEGELVVAQAEREDRQTANVAGQVALSKAVAALQSLRKKRDELESEAKLRRIDGLNLGSADRQLRARLVESELALLRSGESSAQAHRIKEQAEIALAVLGADRDHLKLERDRLRDDLKTLRESTRHERDRAHGFELRAQQLLQERNGLAARIREDYSVELAELATAPIATGTEDDPIPLLIDPATLKDEIEELRKKIAKLGSVNLEALDELADVEKREGELRSQHDDLVDSQKKLAEIIAQINGDSRKLFTETLAAVREQFQELFRKLFGGGLADITLEAGVDPLEAGIEISARPPGKELRSITLLSGGERTMTALALLLAIFRSRPSPFCLLDEVDAALDEANTARLASALREFLDRSQFIIITHKKRTMAMADVIYGITMQESGISKQVSVRFEDWPEEELVAAA